MVEVYSKIGFRPEITLTGPQLAELLLEHYPDDRSEAMDEVWQSTKEVRESLGEPRHSIDQVTKGLGRLLKDGLVERDPSVVMGPQPGKTYRWRAPTEERNRV